MKISIENINFFYINLDYREDRKKHAIEQFSKHNLIVKRERACDDLTNNHLLFGEQWTDGNKKCLLSHYNLMKRYKEEKILGIFEDDVVLCEDFAERLKYIEDNFDKEWDIFYLSAFYQLNDQPGKWNISGDYEKTDVKYIHRVFGSFCTHSLLINPKSIDKIIKMYEENLTHTYAIDHLLIKIQPMLNCYSFTPGIATQLTNKSDIVNEVRDISYFERVLGPHYFANNLSEFDYDEYFKD
jgi:GR25 family glycosyltransferase involved in LPS biosynthesis